VILALFVAVAMHYSCQRQGIGVKLFNAMLEGKGYNIQH
jgi:GNAT acetyltransferase, Mec-17